MASPGKFEYIYIYNIYSNLPGDAIVRQPHLQSKNS